MHKHEQFLDLMRQAPIMTHVLNPDYEPARNAWGHTDEKLPTFAARTLRVPLDGRLAPPGGLSDLGDLNTLRRLQADLRQRGFDVRYRELAPHLEHGVRVHDAAFMLVDNVVSRNQDSGAVGIDVSEQIANVFAAVDAWEERSPSVTNLTSKRPERWRKYNLAAWSQPELLYSLGCCDLPSLAKPFAEAGLHLEVDALDAIELREEVFLDVSGRTDTLLCAKYGPTRFRFKKVGALADYDQPAHMNRDQRDLARAVRDFKRNQWSGVKADGLEKMRQAGMINAQGWPLAGHPVWSDVDADELAYWMLGYSSNQVASLRNQAQQRGQTFNGVSRNVPTNLEPVTRL